MGPLETVGKRVVVGWRFRMKAVIVEINALSGLL